MIAKPYQDSPERFIEECLKIRAKDTSIVPFFSRQKEFPAQRRFIRLVQEIRERREPVRIIGLKARQVGLTSIGAALIYHATALFPNVESRIVSVDLESVEAIHAKNSTFWERSPNALRPMLARSSVKEIYFNNPSRRKRIEKPGLDSKILANTAAKATLGRSHTIQNYLGSEVAFWKDGATRSLAIMQAIPQEPGTMAILESTAQGTGDYFQEKWDEAQSQASIWTPFFFAWHEHPEYRRPLDDEWNAEDPDDEELELIALYRVTPEQIAWRRFTIANYCEGSSVPEKTETFHQEYPSNAKEAFIRSGRPAFNRAHLERQERFLHEGIRMKLTLVGHSDKGLHVHAERDPDSRLVIYGPPEARHAYVCGMDPAKGVEYGDFQVSTIIDVTTGEQKAEWHGLVAPEVFADQSIALAAWYNMAMMVPEKNGEGLNVLAQLIRRQYPHIYVEEEWDSEKERVSHKRGWHQDEQKKHLIMSEIKNGLDSMKLRIHSPELYSEMMDMRRDRLGRYGAPEGKHDDRVSALALAYFVARTRAIEIEQANEPIYVDPVYKRPSLSERVRQYRSLALANDDTPSWSS